MLIKYTFLWFIQLITCQQRNMEPFIVRGHNAIIEDHPHSVYTRSDCIDKNVVKKSWRCGSSIVNQWILLTAAHCLNCMSGSSVRITISVGSSNFTKGKFITTSNKFIVHPDYKYWKASHDLAVIKVKNPLPLGRSVGRVALMRYPAYNEMATVAGWGLVNETERTGTDVLQFTRQSVIPYNRCIRLIGQLPEGCICAGYKNGSSYASEGDSGSALVIRGYIQIGIVSFKRPRKSVSVVAYTDTGYFYNWIIDNAKSLHCQ